MKIIKLTSILLFFQFLAAQAPGDPDVSFVTGNFNGSVFQYSILDIVQKIDGKILVATSYPMLDDAPVHGILCLNPDGSRDNSFNPPNDFTSVEKIILQPDGKILIVGVKGYGSSMIRLNSNGSIDSGFNLLVSEDSELSVQSAVLQSDGKIVIAGFFETVNGSPRNKLARINSDGTLDENFVTNALPADNYNKISVFKQPDEKIIVAGNFGLSVPELRVDLARIYADGTLDNSFTCEAHFIGGQYNKFSLENQADGKILVFGGFVTNNNVYGITRLNNNGDIDNTFDPGLGVSGSTNPIFISHALIEQSGKIIIVGNFDRYFNFDFGNTPRKLLRINSDGSIDTSFSLQGAGAGDVYAAALQFDGKILIGGLIFIRLLSDVNLGLVSSDEENSITIYPNPAQNLLTIKSNEVFSEITIFNNIGQVMIHQKKESMETTIDIGGLPSGVYSVKINSGDKYEVRKLLKHD